MADDSYGEWLLKRHPPGEEGEIGEPAVFRSSGITFCPAPDRKAAHIVLYSDTGGEDEDEDEPDEEDEAEPLPDGVYVDDMEDGVVTLWHHAGELGCTELTPAQARTLAAELVRVAGEVAARPEEPEEPETPEVSVCEQLMGIDAAFRKLGQAPALPTAAAVPFVICAYADGVGYRVEIPSGAPYCGTVRYDADGKPSVFWNGNQAFPFVPETPKALLSERDVRLLVYDELTSYCLAGFGFEWEPCADGTFQVKLSYRDARWTVTIDTTAVCREPDPRSWVATFIERQVKIVTGTMIPSHESEDEWSRIARDRAKSGPGADHVLLDVEFPHGVGSFDPPGAVPKPGAPVMWPGPDGTVTVAEASAEAPEPEKPEPSPRFAFCPVGRSVQIGVGLDGTVTRTVRDEDGVVVDPLTSDSGAEIEKPKTPPWLKYREENKR